MGLGLDNDLVLVIGHRHGGIATHDQDVFVNVVGGVRVTETAADLPVILAILSSLRNRPLPHDLIVFGELGLAGEIRPVPGGQERLREAAKHGYARALVARENAPKSGVLKGMEVVPVNRLDEALGNL